MLRRLEIQSQHGQRWNLCQMSTVRPDSVPIPSTKLRRQWQTLRGSYLPSLVARRDVRKSIVPYTAHEVEMWLLEAK